MKTSISIVKDFASIDKVDWWTLVEESPVASFFQTPDCYTFYASLSFFTPFVYGVRCDGKLVGVVVGYVQMDSSRVKQYFTRRAIVPGGALLSSDISSSALEALLCACKTGLAESAIFVEMRNFSDYSRWKDVFVGCGFSYEEHLNFHLDCSDEVSMIKRMSESKVRQVKKASKNGVEITEAEDVKSIEAFYEILSKLYERKVKTPLFPLEFFLKFYWSGIGKILLVRKGVDIIGGIVAPILDGRVIYEWFVAGKDAEFKNCYPSVMATYGAMKYGCDNGLPLFDFMGAGKPDEGYGVRDFKAKFGGKLVSHGRFRCVMHPLLYFVGKFGVKLLKTI